MNSLQNGLDTLYSIYGTCLVDRALRHLPRDIAEIGCETRTEVVRGFDAFASLGKLSMATGVVKWFNGQKGFGFIQPSDGSSDVFVHISAVERAGLTGLGEGQKVSYELKTDKMRGKTSAENLALV